MEVAKEVHKLYFCSNLEEMNWRYIRLRSSPIMLLCQALECRYIEVAKYILTKYFDINGTYQGVISFPLHLATQVGDTEIVQIILDRGIDINTQNAHGETALHTAIQCGNIDLVKLFLNLGANVNVQTRIRRDNFLQDRSLIGNRKRFELALKKTRGKGYTPLHMAASLGKTEIMRLLLHKGADVHACAFYNQTSAHLATQESYRKCLKMLMEYGANINAANRGGKTILYIAVKNHDLAIVKDILKYLPDMNNRGNQAAIDVAFHHLQGKLYKPIIDALLVYGFSLSGAVQVNRVLEKAVVANILDMAEYALNQGAQINAKVLYFSNMTTLLHVTVHRKQEDITRLLLRYGAKVNIRDERGNSVLHVSIRKGNENIVALLLNKGANIEMTQARGLTALQVACNRNLIKIAVVLVEHGADINVKCRSRQNTPLMHCIKKGYIELAEILLKYGNNNARNKFGRTALHFSVIANNERTTKMLLEYGANPTIKGGDRKTPLHIAVEKDNFKLVRLLLEHGNKNPREYLICGNHNSRLKTYPLILAARRKNIAMMKMLLEYGTDVDYKDNNETALYHSVKKGHVKGVELLLKYCANVNLQCKGGKTPLHMACFLKHIVITDILLQHGANIDISDDLDVTPWLYLMHNIFNMSKLNFQKVIIKHLIQREEVTLVSSNNILSDHGRIEVLDFMNECKQEILLLKCEKVVDSNISYYDLLVRRPDVIAKYIRNEDVAQVLTSGNYKEKFKIYSGSIENNFEKAKEMNEMTDQAFHAFQLFSTDLPILPQDCIMNILNYMTFQDLKIFTLAAAKILV